MIDSVHTNSILIIGTVIANSKYGLIRLNRMVLY